MFIKECSRRASVLKKWQQQKALYLLFDLSLKDMNSSTYSRSRIPRFESSLCYLLTNFGQVNWPLGPQFLHLSKGEINLTKFLYVYIYVCIYMYIYACIYIHKIEYYSTTWKKSRHLQQNGWKVEALCHVRQVRQRKTNTIWYHLHVESKKAELIKTESRMVLGARRQGRCCWRVCPTTSR